MEKNNHNYLVKAYLNKDEFEKLNYLSAQTKMSRSKIIRALINFSRLKTAPPVDYGKLIREIRIVGNNLNRLLLVATTKGWGNVKEINETLLSIRDAEKNILSEFASGKDEVPWQ